jgi:4-amino-4-deoxy-L-arabinose transferase-like glycosyltransferase
VLVVFIALSTLIAVKTPAWEANDEPGHVENIETLVSGHAYVIPSTCHPDRPNDAELLQCAGDEVHQPPLYYLLMAGWQKVVGLAPRAPLSDAVNTAVYFAPGETLLVHTEADDSFIRWLRLPNVALGALTILVVFFAAKLVTEDEWTPVVAAALVAAFPLFVFRSAFVTNDNLVNLLAAVLVYLALRFTLRPKWQWMAAVGACFGLLIATKLSALPLGLLIIGLSLLVSGWRQRIGFAVVGCASALLVSSWYLAWNWVHYGDPLAQTATAHYLASDGALGTLHGRPYVVSDPLWLVFDSVPRTVARTVFYESGWSTFHWSAWLGLVVAVVIGGVLVVGMKVSLADRRQVAILATTVILGLLSVWLIAFQTSTDSARFALMSIGAFAILLALALERWRLPVRFVLPLGSSAH